MKLTDAKCRAAKGKEKPYKLSDGRGLYLLVRPPGNRLWRLDYTVLGRRNTASLGTYPEITLSDAREEAARLRAFIAKGVDVNTQKRKERLNATIAQAATFEKVARDWFEVAKTEWVDTHADRIIRRLERDFFPWIGSIPIAELDAPTILDPLRRIENRGARETAHRALGNLHSIFAFAIAEGRCVRNVATDLEKVLKTPVKTNFAAIVKPADAAGLLLQLDGYQGTLTVQTALKLAPLTFTRPGELRKAKWSDIDLERGTWEFVASKTERDHIVPLSRQAIAVLKELHPLTQYSDYVFPNARDMRRPMSDNAVLAALRRLGIPKDAMTGHGFRAMARTMLEEVLKFPAHIIDHQLAHAVKDANGRAYNRTTLLEERLEMMQVWADYLDKLKKPADVIAFPVAQNQ